MRALSRFEDLPLGQPVAITVGTFDGLHRGHLEIFSRLKRMAGRKRPLHTLLVAVANRQAKHPGQGALLDPAHRLEILKAAGIDTLLTLDFAQIRHLSSRAFIEALAKRVRIEYFCASDKLRIGRDRLGTPSRVAAEIRRVFPEAVVEYLPSLAMGRGKAIISATLIRGLLENGKPHEAARLLGRPYRLEGKVVHGARLGRKLGFPTLNQTPPPDRVIPREGVYLTRVTVAGETRPGLSFVGRPWVQQKKGDPPPAIRLESHLFNFSKSVYNRHAHVEFLRYLRENRRFSNPQALKRRMQADLRAALRYFRPEDKSRT